MALIFNQETVSPNTLSSGARQQILLDDSRVSNIQFRLQRIVLDAGGGHDLHVAPTALAWFQILDGRAELVEGDHRHPVTDAHVIFLPPGFEGRINTNTGVSLLYADVADAQRFDPNFGKKPLGLRIVDWTREPVLLSEHDARKRIYLVTPTLFGTKAIKGEMIIYPPSTEAANHHHEGAAHFMYILTGSGTVFANEAPYRVSTGDIVYYPDRERHYLRSDPTDELRFVEFFVPGTYKTVWAEGASVCTWNPSGADIRGSKAAREIQAHSSAAPTSDI